MSGLDMKPAGDSRKRGVAIILIVGLMAVLMLAAAAFSISMRIERKGAANYRYGVQARHMLWSALAASIEDIHNEQDGVNGFKMYPEWDVIGSPQNTDTNDPYAKFSVPANVLSREALSYLPVYLRGTVQTNATSYWQYLYDAGDEVVGRYAYIVVNTSGLLDANVSGGAPRWMGTNAAELAIGSPGDVAFLMRDNTHRRYESLAELEAINPDLFTMADDLGVYNMSFEGQTLVNPNQVEDQVYIGGDETYLEAHAGEIMDAFARSGVSAGGLAYSNLLDYVDTDSVPRSLTMPCVERTPMINEVILEYELDVQAGGAFSVGYTMDVEWAYPFPVDAQDAFEVAFDVEFVAGADNTYPILVPPTNGARDAVSPSAGSQYGTVSCDHDYSGSIGTNAFTLDFVAHIDAHVLNGAGKNVDQALDIVIPVRYVGLMPPCSEKANKWSECIDPRYNWDTANDKWVHGDDQQGSYTGHTPASSPGARNVLSQYMIDTPSELSSNVDGDMAMYVANAPLRSVGELGYLCIDKWSTIRLYNHNYPALYGPDPEYHKVLDYFTLHNTNGITRGLVNVNTLRPEVLATAFLDAPTGPTTTTNFPALAWNDALDIAADLVALGPHTNLSHIGNLQLRTKGYLGSSELEREAPLRNTAGLLTVRNNCFTILLRSEAYTMGIGGAKAKSGTRLASSRAIAEVWRDPFRDPSAYTQAGHRCFIRSFRILDE